LFTEPQSKADKESGKLSKTAQAHLIKVYIKEYWNRERRITTKYMEKGTVGEGGGIAFLSAIDGRQYTKNLQTRSNGFIVGTTDIVEEDYLVDTKLSWDAETFLPKLAEPLDKDYFYQVQGYLWLWGLDRGKVSYCLVDCPEHIILGEQRKLLYSMDVVTEESPEYLQAAQELAYNLTFQDIPPHERVIDLWVERDETVIEQIPDKVRKARKFLQEFHELHTKNKHPNI
jgi:hypothetical protein